MGRSYEQKTGKQTGYAVGRARKIAAEARLAELRLQKQEGELVPVEAAVQVLAATLAELRARLLAVPGKFAPRCVGLRTTAAAQTRLEEIVDDVLDTLQGAGEAVRDRLLADHEVAHRDAPGTPRNHRKRGRGR